MKPKRTNEKYWTGTSNFDHIQYETDLEDYIIELEAKAEQLRLDVSNNWISIENGLPNELETVWISNGDGWTTLGCLAYAEGGWHWAETNGIIYQDKDKIVSECESNDLDVKFWHRLPEPICKQSNF